MEKPEISVASTNREKRKNILLKNQKISLQFKNNLI